MDLDEQARVDRLTVMHSEVVTDLQSQLSALREEMGRARKVVEAARIVVDEVKRYEHIPNTHVGTWCGPCNAIRAFDDALAKMGEGKPQ